MDIYESSFEQIAHIIFFLRFQPILKGTKLVLQTISKGTNSKETALASTKIRIKCFSNLWNNVQNLQETSTDCTVVEKLSCLNSYSKTVWLTDWFTDWLTNSLTVIFLTVWKLFESGQSSIVLTVCQCQKRQWFVTCRPLLTDPV